MAKEDYKTQQKAKAAKRRMGNGPSATLAPGEKAKDFRKAMKDTLTYMGGYRWAILAVFFIAALATIFETLGPKVMGKATTLLADGIADKIHGTGGIDFDAIAGVLIITIILYAIGAIAQFVQAWIMTNITQRVVFNLRRDLSEKINRMPMKYFESVQTGEVLSRITNDVDTLGQGLSQSVSNFIWSIVSIVGIIVVMLTINVKMTLIALITVPLSAGFMALLIKFSQPHFQAQQENLGVIDGQIEENFSGHLVIKAFNREEQIVREFEKTNNKLYESAWKSQFLSGLMHPVMIIVSNMGYAAVVLVGGVLCAAGSIGVGDIQAFVQYVKNLSQPIQTIAQIMNQVQSMAAAAERVFEFLDEAEESEYLDELNKLLESAERNDVSNGEDKDTARTLQPGNNTLTEAQIKFLEAGKYADASHIKGEVVFEHVRFGYDEDAIVINDFSAEVKPGQKIAIVGPTGAGKTTMVKLLMRFYDVNGGSIKLDGRDIREYRRDDLRENFAMVLQDTWLFKGTIRENIRYGREDATDEEVVKAAKAAKADHFIRTLTGGYDMVLNEDASNISEGQRQLLTIARAILADDKLLILDEATSSVDTRTEEEIQKAMDVLTKGRTSFIIAHRLSTIRNADLILVMNHGDIVEQGNHEELLAGGGFYAELYNSQFEML